MTAVAEDRFWEDEVGPLSDTAWAEKRRAVKMELPEALNDNELPDILLKHQKDILASTSTFSLTATDKSRRIGATWGVGADAVLCAGASPKAGGMDVLYLGYNLDMAREFIDTCGMWARAFSPACTEVGEFLFEDKGKNGEPDKHIKAFRIGFASGFEIIALSSAPRSLRGRQGYVILDEFAFHDNAEELLKAAMAYIIWGGKVLVISTHNGVDNPFNKLLEDIRTGQYGPDANVVRCTFDEAVANGLYERVCLKRGIEWSAEGEAEWRANIRKIYRSNAGEELDCIPSEGSGVYISRAAVRQVMSDRLAVVTLACPKGFALKPDDYRNAYVREWLTQNVAPLIATFEPNLRSYFGQDFARNGDVSPIVFGQTDLHLNLICRFILEMRDVPFREQEFVLKWVVDQLPQFCAGKMDARGNGQAQAEYAQQKWGANRIEAVMATDATYLAYMPKLRQRIEDRTILLPADENTASDLGLIKLVRGIPKVPETVRNADATGDGKRHGDNAIALMHICAAADEDVGPIAVAVLGTMRVSASETMITTTGFGTVRRRQSGLHF
ncbi:hypothetical protein [Sphingobium sp.]|uniref:hypothetical protein n=1 Tax=Sphingobium sp. TaxID=1912891 RepID=UPI00260D256C|nr:hypothetical protein [Sphingobium sp.]